MNTLVASPRYVQKRVVSPRPSWSGYLLLILTLIVLPGVSLKAAEKPAKQGLNLGGLARRFVQLRLGFPIRRYPQLV